MSTFRTSATASQPSESLLDSALVTLTSNGFAITQRGPTTATLVGPGLNSTRQNALLGASTITLRVNGNQLEADAELGGVDRMRRFLTWFPPLLGLGLGLLFGIGGGFLFGRQFGIGFGVPWAPGWWWLLFAFGASMLPVTPWLILSPLLARSLRDRTQRALETLVRNATMSGAAEKQS